MKKDERMTTQTKDEPGSAEPQTERFNAEWMACRRAWKSPIPTTAVLAQYDALVEKLMAARAPLRDAPKDLGESKKNQKNSGPEVCASCDHPLQKDSDGPTRFCPNPGCARWLMTVGPSRPPVPLTTEGENK